MQETCKGFVLKTIPYGDSGLIVKLLTDTDGPLSFMVRGAKRKGKSSGAGVFAPMNHISITFIRKENRAMFTAGKYAMHEMYGNLLTDIRKTAISVYMAEALYKVSTEGHTDMHLYPFAAAEMSRLNEADQLAHFPQQFLAGLIACFGISPGGRFSIDTPDFSVKDGLFLPQYEGEAAYRVSGETAEYISLLVLNRVPERDFSLGVRRESRRRLEDYIRLHLENKFSLLSGEVLETVFDD